MKGGGGGGVLSLNVLKSITKCSPITVYVDRLDLNNNAYIADTVKTEKCFVMLLFLLLLFNGTGCPFHMVGIGCQRTKGGGLSSRHRFSGPYCTNISVNVIYVKLASPSER